MVNLLSIKKGKYYTNISTKMWKESLTERKQCYKAQHILFMKLSILPTSVNVQLSTWSNSYQNLKIHGIICSPWKMMCIMDSHLDNFMVHTTKIYDTQCSLCKQNKTEVHSIYIFLCKYLVAIHIGMLESGSLAFHINSTWWSLHPFFF